MVYLAPYFVAWHVTGYHLRTMRACFEEWRDNAGLPAFEVRREQAPLQAESDSNRSTLGSYAQRSCSHHKVHFDLMVL